MAAAGVTSRDGSGYLSHRNKTINFYNGIEYVRTVSAKSRRLTARVALGACNSHALVAGQISVLAGRNNHREPIRDDVSNFLDGPIVPNENTSESGQPEPIDMGKSVSPRRALYKTKEIQALASSEMAPEAGHEPGTAIIRLDADNAGNAGTNAELDIALERVLPQKTFRAEKLEGEVVFAKCHAAPQKTGDGAFGKGDEL